MIVVSDASPLIALARIDRLELLREMFGTLLLPDSVWNEVTAAGVERPGAASVLRADWIERRSVSDSALVARLRLDLGAGESEAIALARESRADVLLIDERLGRIAAQRLGLRVTGLVGVLIEARQRGLLADAATVASDLEQKAGFWLSDDLRRLIAGS
jgi:predicted nucleic acid-binding protein